MLRGICKPPSLASMFGGWVEQTVQTLELLGRAALFLAVELCTKIVPVAAHMSAVHGTRRSCSQRRVQICA